MFQGSLLDTTVVEVTSKYEFTRLLHGLLWVNRHCEEPSGDRFFRSAEQIASDLESDEFVERHIRVESGTAKRQGTVCYR